MNRETHYFIADNSNWKILRTIEYSVNKYAQVDLTKYIPPNQLQRAFQTDLYQGLKMC